MKQMPSLWYLAPMVLLGAVAWGGLAKCAFGETIRHDMGGSVAQRLEQMQTMSSVRIVGACYSSCTMLLGVPDACVTPSARLGFHGPSTRSGLPLLRSEWDRVSRIMAEQYPPKIRMWFLASGRLLSAQHMRVFHGSELINMGVKECRG